MNHPFIVRSSRSHLAPTLLLGGLLLGGTLAGCSKPVQEAPPPPPPPSRLPEPPVVRDVSMMRPEFYNIGDSVSVVLDATGGQIPITWGISGIPDSWSRVTDNEGRFYRLSGRMPVGASSSGLTISVSVRDSNGLQSRPLEIQLATQPKVYDFQPTLVEENEDETERTYHLRLRSLPAWDARFRGRVEVWVDTAGLTGSAGDTIRLWDDTVSAMDRSQPYAGDGASQSGTEERGELFVLRTVADREALDDDRLMLTVRSGNPRARVAKIQVRVY